MAKRIAFCLVCNGGGKFLGRPGSQKDANIEAASHSNVYSHSVTIVDAPHAHPH